MSTLNRVTDIRALYFEDDDDDELEALKYQHFS